MVILVTGGAGYIGSVVVDELWSDNNEVIVLDNLQEGHREAVLPSAVFYEGDFGDRQLLKQLFQQHHIDAVLHFAAETTIEFSMTDPGLYFRNNVVNGITLLDVMVEYSCNRFIFSSTAATYGEPIETPITENHPTNPINVYGESKLMFEKILEWYHKAYGLQYNCFRYFNAAGASKILGEDHKTESHLIPLVLKTALCQQEYVKVFGTDYETKDGTCIRDYIHVIDLAQAHILALENLDTNPNRIYNLGNGEGYSVKEVIETAKKVTGKNIPIKEDKRRPGDPAVLIASSEFAKKELGWNPKFPDIESIIRTAWEWHCKFPNGYIVESEGI